MQDEFVARLQSMLAIEDMIEKVIDELKSKGILDRTYIFFTSDHGYHMGEHRLFSAKDTLYEEDVRVPLIVRGPNLPKNVTKEEFVINHDLPITFAHLGGAQVPGFVDGMSMAFASTLQYQPRYFVLLEHWPKPNEFNLKGEIKGVRDNQYKYLEYDTGETELYDLQSDPHETNNLLGSPVEVLNLEVQYISNEMEKKLRELEACQTDACREAEQTGILTPYIPPRG